MFSWFTCLLGRGEPENARLSFVADAETAFEHSSGTRHIKAENISFHLHLKHCYSAPQCLWRVKHYFKKLTIIHLY